MNDSNLPDELPRDLPQDIRTDAANVPEPEIENAADLLELIDQGGEVRYSYTSDTSDDWEDGDDADDDPPNWAELAELYAAADRLIAAEAYRSDGIKVGPIEYHFEPDDNETADHARRTVYRFDGVDRIRSVRECRRKPKRPDAPEPVE